mmetsp:Transcript_64651/g.168125  ORF Transcript_64651/g.168125 Transcript_64651/m.168125 type:complete len:214 (-) Transcript_64651:2005-2646(-)
MKAMNSLTSARPDRSESTARQRPRRSSSLSCLGPMDSPGKPLRTTPTSSSKAMFPLPSSSQAVKTLYQLPPARCHFSAALFMTSMTRLMSFARSTGQVSICKQYTARSNSAAEDSPVPSASTARQKARRWSAETRSSPMPRTRRTALRYSGKLSRVLLSVSTCSMSWPQRRGWCGSTRRPRERSQLLMAMVSLVATVHNSALLKLGALAISSE